MRLTVDSYNYDTIIVIGLQHSTVTQGSGCCAQFHINNDTKIRCHSFEFECDCLKLSSDPFRLIARDTEGILNIMLYDVLIIFNCIEVSLLGYPLLCSQKGRLSI